MTDGSIRCRTPHQDHHHRHETDLAPRNLTSIACTVVQPKCPRASRRNRRIARRTAPIGRLAADVGSSWLSEGSHTVFDPFRPPAACARCPAKAFKNSWFCVDGTTPVAMPCSRHPHCSNCRHAQATRRPASGDRVCKRADAKGDGARKARRESDAKVLIVGESGVGKDLVAREIHHASKRSHGPFVAVSCAGVPETLLESELFGHLRGSFTGAYRDRPGKLQMADQGTLFLDEVGEMSLRMQALLLRFLESGEIQTIGGSEPKSVNVRIVAVTNRDLPQRVAAGEFREDLLYRLRVIQIVVPPLRERKEDIQFLVDNFSRNPSP